MASQFGQSFIGTRDVMRREQDTESQLIARQTQAVNTAIGEQLKITGQFVKSFQEGKYNGTPEQFQEQIDSLIAPAIRTAQIAKQSGIQSHSPEQLESFKQALLRSATPTQISQTQGQAKGTGLVAEAESVSSSGGVPLVEAQQARGLRPAPPSSAINIYTTERTKGAGEKKATEKFGSGIGERANKRLEQAFDAQRQNNQLERVKLALSRGAETGGGQEFKLDMLNFGRSLGLEIPDTVPEQEIIRTISNEMALRLRNPESGLGLTGNTSNKDLQFLKDSVIGLSRTPQGNLALIDLMNKFNGIKISVAEEQQRIISANGGVVPIDIDTKLMKFVNKQKFLTDEERKQIESLSKPGGGTSAIQGLSPEGAAARSEEHTSELQSQSN